jgi:hypothetical protein
MKKRYKWIIIALLLLIISGFIIGFLWGDSQTVTAGTIYIP